jgi:hypothetical protein
VNGGVPLRVALADLEGWLREQGLIGGGKKVSRHAVGGLPPLSTTCCRITYCTACC